MGFLNHGVSARIVYIVDDVTGITVEKYVIGKEDTIRKCKNNNIKIEREKWGGRIFIGFNWLKMYVQWIDVVNKE